MRDILEYFCGELTDSQWRATKYHIDNGYLYGIGRALGRTAFMPLVSKDGKRFNVIDGAGYKQIAAIDGRLGTESLTKTYKREKHGKEM